MTPTYRISTWEIDDEWVLHESGLSMWDLKRAIRHLRNCGYEDDVSILVERDGPSTERAMDGVLTELDEWAKAPFDQVWTGKLSGMRK